MGLIMSHTHPGMPGPGGSLGECAFCGGNFIAEILLGDLVPQIEVKGCSQTLSAHHACIEKFKGTQWADLPDESPLKRAWLKLQPEKPA